MCTLLAGKVVRDKGHLLGAAQRSRLEACARRQFSAAGDAHLLVSAVAELQSTGWSQAAGAGPGTTPATAEEEEGDCRHSPTDAVSVEQAVKQGWRA